MKILDANFRGNDFPTIKNIDHKIFGEHFW